MKSLFASSARATALGGILLVLGVAGCNAPDATAPAATPERFTPGVSAFLQPSFSLVVGDTSTVFSPLAKWALSEQKIVNWSTSNAAKLSVSAVGLVTALDTGKAYAVVQLLGWTDSIPVLVTNIVVANVALSLSGNVTVGGSAQLSITLTDSKGNVLTGRPVSYSSANPGVATVSPAGLVNGQSVGTVTLRATSGSATGTLAVNVTGGSGGGGAVTLPMMPQTFNVSYPAVTGTSWVLKKGDNLQTAINAAKRGDEIVLPANATFVGNFTLPAKAGNASNGWITIRGDKLKQFPAGTRVTPRDANNMPVIQSPNQTAALATALSASGWYVAGVELTNSSAWRVQAYAIVQLGDGSYQQKSLSQVATDLVLDRVYIHGATTSQLSRCVALNSARTAIIDSYLGDCHGRGFDAQAIAGWNGPGPFKIVNNTIIGSAENIMFGGSDPHIPGLIPSDIEIRRNYIYTPVAWKGVWMKKNLLETKNARRMLIEGNVFDGSWQDGQVGYAMLLKSVNQGGGCTWCASGDITIRYNIVRNAGAGFSFAGLEGLHPVGARLARVLVEQNIVENINTGPFTGDSRLILLIQNLSDLTVRNNTMTAPGALGAFLYLGSGPAATNMDYSGNIVSHGSYGLFATGLGVGETSLGNVKGTVNFTNDVIIATPRQNYPHATLVPTLAAALATGKGANLTAVNAATQGVIIP